MKTAQISLLDKCELRYLTSAVETTIIVKKLEFDCLSTRKIMATVFLKDDTNQIKDTLFEDMFGQQYVGVRLSPYLTSKDKKNALPLHKIDQAFSEKLLHSITSIQLKIKKLREQYYAK